jgi:hypothetical protein
MKKNSWQDKVFVIKETLTDKYLLPETKLVVIYGILSNINGKIEIEQFCNDIGVSKYKMKKVEKQLVELGILKISDI